MPEPVVRPYPIYYQSKKIGEAFESDAGINPNRQPVFGAEGMIAHTYGAVVSSLSFKYVIPVNGTSLDFLSDCINQKNIDIGIPVGGQFVVVTMAIMSCNMTANIESGKCEGSLSLAGGKPTIT